MPTAQSTMSSVNNKVNKKIAKVAAAVVGNQEEQPQVAAVVPQQASGGIKTPQEQPEFIKQALIIIEKKVRNLEKRKLKLEEYKDVQSKGTTLNEDQSLAVSKYEEVLRSLELSRELEKQFVGLANDAMKQQKKQTKKEQIEREEAIKEKLRESQKLLSVLDAFAKDEVRNDFLNEKNGCTFKMTQKQLDLLDDFSQLVQSIELGSKLDANAAEAAEHLLYLIESKNKLIPSLESKQQITYSDLRKLFDQVLSSNYWNKQQQVASSTVEAAAVETEVVSLVDESLGLAQVTNNESNQNNNNLDLQSQSNLIEPMSNLNVALEKTNEALLHTATSFNQQNTSDDYVLVSPSNEFTENNNSQTQLQKSPNSQQLLDQQQQQPKTFFTTIAADGLPQTGQHRNINEFLNRCENSDEGINFLQDSEIRQQQQQNSDNFQNTENNSQFKPRHNNQRNEYSNNNGPSRNYPARQRNYQDDNRRSGGSGMPRNNSGGAGINNGAVNGGANQNMTGSSSNNYNNNNMGRSQGSNGGYRGSNNTGGMRTGGGSGNSGANVNNVGGGGGYRGGNNGGGMRQSNGGGAPSSNGPRVNTNYRQDNPVISQQQQQNVVQK